MPTTSWIFRAIVKYVLVSIAVIVLTMAFALWWMSSGVFATDRFKQKVWLRPIRETEDSTCYRGGMARDIEKRVLEAGITKADVERLLGAPDFVQEPREYRYTLGMCSGFKIDYDDLHIYFNEHGTFERSAIIQH